MSEYAVTGNDAGKGSLLAALGEAGFLIGLEKNRYLCSICLISFSIIGTLPARTRLKFF